MSDAAQFEGFVRAYQDMVYATAVRLLGNAADAEDIAQSVFLKAFQRFDMLEDNPAAAGWLKKVATNDALNHLSRYRRRWRFFSELGPADWRDDAVDLVTALTESAVADDRLQRAEEQQQLDTALLRLPDHQRVPLVLFHFEDKSYQEIAALLRISLSKVKVDIHRGREALRAHLGASHGTR